METQDTFANNLWQLQNDMKNVFATQTDHTERLSRLERRQDDDARMRSVWGNSSPFPSILSGTPQQDPGYNPAAEAFKNFDQDHPGNLLGSLHLDTEEEPRRGTSRANSVRFDETALHGHFGHGSRSSSDFFPPRTGSGLGSHPMTERSSSHKSDGRHSSAGHSNHSGRLNSLGFDTRQSTLGSDLPMVTGPPPGLFILGPLPSIIRCWLNTNFSNDSLIYAAVCTGSFKSVVDQKLINKLGIESRVEMYEKVRRIKISVYLPEATIQQSSSRSASPTPQLPSLAVDFDVENTQAGPDDVQVFLGSDVLRARNAEISFSQDRLTLYDDDRNKVAVPLVRPENAAVYQHLVTKNAPLQASEEIADTPKATQEDRTSLKVDTDLAHDFLSESTDRPLPNRATSFSNPAITRPSAAGKAPSPPRSQNNSRKGSPLSSEAFSKGNYNPTNDDLPDTPVRTESGPMWGSWRRDSSHSARPDVPFSAVASTSNYQRAGRGRGMKVLKPTRSNTSTARSASGSISGSGFDALSPRTLEGTRSYGNQNNGNGIPLENQRPDSPRRSFSGEGKLPPQIVPNKPRSTNPVGGASAFGWLNASQQQRSTSTTE